MGRARGVTWLFGITAFVGAGLLFVVQPLVARLLLPAYGGSATVWSTASLFFQVLLLLSYLWAHWSVRRLGRRWQPRLQVVLLLLPVVMLPLALPSDPAPGPDTEPALWLLRTLALLIGLPFAVVACTGPVIQRWYSWVGERGEDPYFLFAASNLGSFGGLLAYPFLVEPSMSLATQRLAWSIGFAAYAVLMAACSLVAMRGSDPASATSREEVATPRPSGRRLATWGLLAFVPSSLMLGVTAHLSTDVTPIPLLWVVPLAVYLATFVVAFARSSRRPPVWAARLSVPLAVVALFAIGETDDLLPAVLAGVGLLAVVAFAAHGRLAADRPPADHLTLFYLVVAAGGAVGGLVNGLLAPALLDQVLEYPLLLVALPLLLLGLTRVWAWPVGLTAGLLAFTLWSGALQVGGALEETRSFFGAYRVVERTDGSHVLVHGTTVHGIQFQDEDRRHLATTYYAGPGSCADVFAAMSEDLAQGGRVGVVGLGAGTVATYGVEGERMTFFEIDPDIVATAQDPALFTFLADSAADVDVVVGDGRLSVADVPSGTFDLLVLDAFSSDSIPVHLLTREAIEEYAAALAPGGVLLVHVSSRFFDLRPVLADASDRLGWRASLGTSRGEGDGATASSWIALTSDVEVVRKLESTESWQPLPMSPRVEWTDDYSSILAVLS